MKMLRCGRLFGLLLGSCALAWAQEPATRTEALEREAAEKARHLKPDEPTKAERRVEAITKGDWIGRVTGGFPGLRVKVGGLVTGSGFGFGPEYSRPDLLRENMSLRISAVGSFKLYYKTDFELAFPRLAGRRFAASFLASHSDYNSLPYYGQGQDSSRRGKTNFRREDTNFDFYTGWRPFRQVLLIGVRGGVWAVNVGPGQGSTPSSETVYRPPVTVGIDQQARFLRGGPFVQLDFRDSPGDPHRGGNYRLEYNAFSDRTRGRYSFRRLEASAEQYLPFFNEKRVLAFRARTTISYRGENQQVPFYLQPTLGGADDLRGFQLFRFYDNNLILLNGEYRWEIFPGLDMALFGDGGKVFRRVRQFNLHDLDGAGGIGFRLKSRNTVVMRVDIGASREGVRIWLKFGNIF
jgi:outer membrane protein assembly factor BamA